jgi:hypothetical protein
MSATLDPQLLKDYFLPFSKFSLAIPVIKCEIQIHRVYEFHLEDVSEFIHQDRNFMNSLQFDLQKPQILDEQIQLLSGLFYYIDRKELQHLP